MSERIFALLLRLYPKRFREQYGAEYLQLSRERLRDETGLGRRLRMWFDLLVDLAVSLPCEYRRVESEWIGRSAPQSARDVPAFMVLESHSPAQSHLLFAGVVSVLTFVGLPTLINHFGNVPPSSEWQASRSDSGTDEKAEAQPQTSTGAPAAGDSSQEASPQLDSAARHRIIANAVAALKQHHVDPAIADKAAAALLLHERNGDDESFTSTTDFARALTVQMRDATGDRDLELIFSRREIPEMPSRSLATLPPGYAEQIRQMNCGFEHVEMIAGNIGYVKLNVFGDTSVCEPTAREAMSRVNTANAVIFDLRENRGGFGSMVKLLASYLFDHPEYLFSPIENTTRDSWTRSPVAGNKLASKPVYILTSARTISAAEDFAYNLQMLKRATIVGETTAGAAHAATLHHIGENFYLGTTEVQPINPYSNHDWNGTGIQPDVKVPAADALATALKLAGTAQTK